MLNYQFFVRLCEASFIPVPVSELKFHEKRKWRLDFAWPEYKLALEVEGGIHTGGRHTRGVGFTKDMEKYNELTRMGWRLIRCSPSDLYKLSTLDLIRDCITTINNNA